MKEVLILEAIDMSDGSLSSIIEATEQVTGETTDTDAAPQQGDMFSQEDFVGVISNNLIQARVERLKARITALKAKLNKISKTKGRGVHAASKILAEEISSLDFQIRKMEEEGFVITPSDIIEVADKYGFELTKWAGEDQQTSDNSPRIFYADGESDRSGAVVGSSSNTERIGTSRIYRDNRSGVVCFHTCRISSCSRTNRIKCHIRNIGISC